MTTLAFVDTETTGLDDRRHEIWEVALILRDTDDESIYLPFLWQLPVNLNKADPIALNIGKFHERRWSEKLDFLEDETIINSIINGSDLNRPSKDFIVPYNMLKDWAKHFTELTFNSYLVGNVISFDEERLRKLLRKYDQCPVWNYHIADVEAIAAGKLGIQPPWKGNTISEALGIPVPENQHSAMTDAAWAMDIYYACFSKENS